MKQVNTIYINGKFETPHGSELLTLVDPVTEQDAAQVVLADEVDAQRAIAAASAAYRELAGSSRELRMEWLRRLHDALTRARAITPLRLDILQRIAPEPRQHLSVQERGKVMLIAVSDIRYLRAELKYVTVRTAAREHLVEDSLSRLEQEFADQFVRIHRSCLVARAHVVGFEKEAAEAGESHWVVILNGLDEKLPVSRRLQHIVKEFGRSLL